MGDTLITGTLSLYGALISSLFDLEKTANTLSPIELDEEVLVVNLGFSNGGVIPLDSIILASLFIIAYLMLNLYSNI